MPPANLPKSLMAPKLIIGLRIARFTN